ncbi:hypothetical protein [Pseudochryseolinea flava]|nr:hypothetical protein [Pseudochryseolinea flava]
MIVNDVRVEDNVSYLDAVIDEKYLLFTREKTHQVFDLVNQSTMAHTASSLRMCSCYNNTIVGSSDRTLHPSGVGFKAKFHLMSFPTLNVLKTLAFDEMGNCTRVGDILIFEHSQIITAISLSTEEVLWDVPFGKVLKMLMVVDSILWMQVNLNSKYSVIKGIKIETGSIVDDFNGVACPGYAITIVSQDDGQVFISNNDNSFLQLDVQKKTVSRSGIIESLDGVNMNLVGATLCDDCLYFSASHGKLKGGNTIGVLDFKTLEMLWSTKLPTDATGFIGIGIAPIVGKNNLYILDSNNLLHNFKRTAL